MKSVYEIIAKIASELPSDCIRMAAKSLASGTPCGDAVSLWGGQLARRKLIADFGALARASGLSAGEIAAALLSAATTAENFFAENAVDILWTGTHHDGCPRASDGTVSLRVDRFSPGEGPNRELCRIQGGEGLFGDSFCD